MRTCILTFTQSISVMGLDLFLPLHTVSGVGLDLFSPLHTVSGVGLYLFSPLHRVSVVGLYLFSPLHRVSGVGLEAEASFGQQWYRSLSNPWYPDAVSRQT